MRFKIPFRNGKQLRDRQNTLESDKRQTAYGNKQTPDEIAQIPTHKPLCNPVPEQGGKNIPSIALVCPFSDARRLKAKVVSTIGDSSAHLGFRICVVECFVS